MNIKTLLFGAIVSVIPALANAELIYRVEQEQMPLTEIDKFSQTLAQKRRFYIGGYYNFNMWNDFTDSNNTVLKGDDTSSFDIVAGVRLYDIFRLEANYIKTDAKYDAFSIDGNTFMLNAIFDARIDSPYRIFKSQILVPYVGFGAGASWNKADNGIDLKSKISPVLSAIAGISVEFNSIFALDFGYKYMYLMDGDTDTITDFAPNAHQFRAGARIHF